MANLMIAKNIGDNDGRDLRAGKYLEQTRNMLIAIELRVMAWRRDRSECSES
jgi:hypothetical protein